MSRERRVTISLEPRYRGSTYAMWIVALTAWLWVAMLALLVLTGAATSRPGHRPVEAPVPPSQQVASVTDDGRTGAPYVAPSAATQGGAPTPRPSEKLGDFSSYQKPTPQPRIVDGISGWATYWNSFGSGFYAALRPDLGGRGDIAIVCGGSPWHCKSVNVITTCACGDRHGQPTLIDLSLDLYREFADPSAGLVWVSVQVVGRG